MSRPFAWLVVLTLAAAGVVGLVNIAIYSPLIAAVMIGIVAYGVIAVAREPLP